MKYIKGKNLRVGMRLEVRAKNPAKPGQEFSTISHIGGSYLHQSLKTNRFDIEFFDNKLGFSVDPEDVFCVDEEREIFSLSDMEAAFKAGREDIFRDLEEYMKSGCF